MTTAVRVSGELVKEAKIYSKIDKRSITGQIEHWARIGKCAEDNPDLTYSLIKEILIGVAELEQGESSEYDFSKLVKNPYAKHLKKQVTLRLGVDVIEYFKKLS